MLELPYSLMDRNNCLSIVTLPHRSPFTAFTSQNAPQSTLKRHLQDEPNCIRWQPCSYRWTNTLSYNLDKRTIQHMHASIRHTCSKAPGTHTTPVSRHITLSSPFCGSVRVHAPLFLCRVLSSCSVSCVFIIYFQDDTVCLSSFVLSADT